MIFKTFVEDEASQILVIKTLHDVWKNNQQVILKSWIALFCNCFNFR